MIFVSFKAPRFVFWDTAVCICHLLKPHTCIRCGREQVDSGVDKDLVFGDPKAPRFVFWDRKLRPTPSGPDVLTFDLLSIWGKIRAGLGAAGLKRPLPGQQRSVIVPGRQAG
jgi:hypothetical protein